MTKIEAARQEYKDWCSAIGIDTIEKVNEVVDNGNAVPLINLCEARQERKYAECADQIFWRRKRASIVMISGPSSSGKTSSSLRIAQQCRVLGISPKVIELVQHFFVHLNDFIKAFFPSLELSVDCTERCIFALYQRSNQKMHRLISLSSTEYRCFNERIILGGGNTCVVIANRIGSPIIFQKRTNSGK